MLYQQLTKENYLLLAIKHYDNPACSSITEFNEDFNRIKYLKKLLRKYRTAGDLKERLIINHIVTLLNVFGPCFTPSILFFRLEKEFHPILKTFLTFLYAIPIDGKLQYLNTLDTESIPFDREIITVLRSIDERAFK
jgi:hypothetical protein